MDLVELLVLAAFIFFPLLQALLEKLGGSRRQELPPEWEVDQEDTEGPVATVERRDTVAADSDKDTSWSAGWGEWPGTATAEAEQLEDLTAESVVTEEEAEEILYHQIRVPDERMSEAARVTVPVVSLEPAERPRTREPRAPRVEVAPPPDRARAQRRNQFSRILHDEVTLRRSVMLAEVLGPPRALREADLDP